MPRNTTELGPPALVASLSTDELIKKLKACSKYLSESEDLKAANSTTLHSLSTSLLQSFLHNHRSKEVKTLTASCVAEVFRLFHPNPPYDDEELKLVFALFIAQLKGLEKPTNPTYKQTFQLLESLFNLQVFLLCLTLDSPETLADLFRMVFSVISAEQTSKVKQYLMEILTTVLQEGESFSQVVLDAILINIIEPNKTSNKAVYDFTVELIQRTSSSIEPFIHQFFNNTLLVGKSSESELGDHLYQLIFELHAIDSTVLLAVLPQLESKLSSADTEERKVVTSLLAKMFYPRESKLARENRPLWNCFLGRYSDASPAIRLECVKVSKFFLLCHPLLAEDVANKLHERFLDKDERVRCGVVKVVCDTADDNFKAVSQLLLNDLVMRLRDKSWNIRRECMINLARLYRKLLSSSSSTDAHLKPSIVRLYSWIPTKIIHCYYLETPEDRLCVERCVLSCIVPVNINDMERMERLLCVYASLDVNASKAFDQMLVSRHQLRGHIQTLINTIKSGKLSDACTKNQLLTSVVIPIAKKLPDSIKAQIALKEFAGLLENDGKLLDSLPKTVDIKLSCGVVQKSKGELMNKLTNHHSCVEAVKNLVDASCPMFVDATCIQILVENVCTVLCDKPVGDSQEEEEEAFIFAKKGVRLLKVLASIMPINFGSSEVFQGLINLLNVSDSEIAKNTLQMLDLVGRHVDSKVTSCLQPILTKMALSGPVELAKYSVKCIQHTFKDPQPILEKLCTSLVSHVDYDDRHFHTVLVSLGQVAKLQPKVFYPHYKTVIKTNIVKNLFVRDRDDTKYDTDNDFMNIIEWCDDEEVSYEAKAKVYATKLLVNWLLGDDLAEEKTLLPVVRMLSAIIQSNGDLQQRGHICPSDRSRLRLAAGCGLLKLAASSHFKELITVEQFQSLACVIQDTCEQVRSQFAVMLNKSLKSLKLPLRYLSIFVLAGAESRKAEKMNFRNMLIANVEHRRKAMNQFAKLKETPQAFLPEYAVSHAVYLIAHHPNFRRTDSSKLDKFKDLLWFFLEPIVVKGNNYNFLMKLLETIKHTVDAQNPDNAEKSKDIYTTCDLAMGALSKITHIKLESFTGEVLLPTKLYTLKDMSSKPTVKYLPPGYDCTPTKLNADGSVTKKEEKDSSAKKLTPKKPASDGTKFKISKSPNISLSKPKGTKKRGFVTSTPAVQPTKEKSRGTKESQRRKGMLPRKIKDSPNEKNGTLSDNEEEIVEDDPSGSVIPKPGKRQRVTTVGRKRNVRRKVLQEDQAPASIDSEDTDTLAESFETDPSPALPAVDDTNKPEGSRRSNRKRASQKVATNVNDDESSHENEAVESDAVTVTPPKKRRKVAVVNDAPKPTSNVKSSGIKRKARHRR